MARIRVVGASCEIEAAVGTSLLRALQAADYPISTSCGGRALCGLCRLTVVQGRELLSPLNAAEIGHLGNVAKVIGLRLACQAIIERDGELELDVPPVSDVAARKRKQQLRRASGMKNGDRTKAAERPEPLEQIEWRPRKLASGQGGEQR